MIYNELGFNGPQIKFGSKSGELRVARMTRGLSQRTVASTVGISTSVLRACSSSGRTRSASASADSRVRFMAREDIPNAARAQLRDSSNGLGAMLEQLRVEFGRLRPGQAGEQVPVLDGHELQDLALPIGDQLQRDRLHAAGAQPTPDLVPEQRADLVAHQTIEDSPGLLCIDDMLIDSAGMLHRGANCLWRDFVEKDAKDFGLVAVEDFFEMLADRFAFPIRVGSEKDTPCSLRRSAEFFDDFFFPGDEFVDGFEIVIEINSQLALGQILHVAERSLHDEVLAQIFIDRVRFRG